MNESDAPESGLTVGPAALFNPRLLDAPLSPPSTAIPNPWVEKGVIWQLRNLLLGFISYSAATSFFSSVKRLGYEPAPSSWYEAKGCFVLGPEVLQWTCTVFRPSRSFPRLPFTRLRSLSDWASTG